MTRLVAALQTLDARLASLGRALGVAMLVGVVAVALAQVVWRYALRAPLVWSEELATYLFIWLAMLGAAVAVREGAHYGFMLLMQRTRPALRALVAMLTHALCLAVAVAIAWLGAEMALAARDTSASLGVGMGWFYAAIPVGGGLMAMHFLVRLVALAVEPIRESAPADALPAP